MLDREEDEDDVEVLACFSFCLELTLFPPPPTFTMVAIPLPQLEPASLPPEKLLSVLRHSSPKSNPRISKPKLLALLLFLTFFLLRLFTLYQHNHASLLQDHYPFASLVHPTIGISLSRTCSEAGYEPFDAEFRHDPSEASSTWRRIPWPDNSPWDDQEGEEEGGDWCKRGGAYVDWEGEVSSKPEENELDAT